MKRTILEVTCDRCGVTQQFETSSNHGMRLVATIEAGTMLDRHQWAERRIEGAGQFITEDVCHVCQRHPPW